MGVTTGVFVSEPIIYLGIGFLLAAALLIVARLLWRSRLARHARKRLEAAGVEAPKDLHGRSLVPVLKGSTPADWRKSFYYHYYEYPGPHSVRRHYGVVTDRYKLVRFYLPDIDAWELFDLKLDPHELRNAIDDPTNAQVVADLKKELEHLRAELKVPAQPPKEAYGTLYAPQPAAKKAAPKKKK